MTKLKRFATLVPPFFTLLFSWVNTALSADSSEKLTRIRMGLAARSTTSMPFFVAKERGFFREEGLEVES